jgi:hypothetical protein
VLDRADVERRKSGGFENRPYLFFGHLERLAVERAGKAGSTPASASASL